MNSTTTYYNHITLPLYRRLKRIGLVVGVLGGVLAIALLVSYQINQLHIKELGGQSRYQHLTKYSSGVTNTESVASVQGITTSVKPTAVSTVGFIDYRAYVLDEYFKYYNSPLYGTGELFVKSCNRYGAPADCTTVAAIAHAETDLCKYHNSADYYNCWGFGGGGPDRIYFDSWAESIDLVTSRLVFAYGLKYMIDPSLMETTFCGDEPGCTNWGVRVKYFMNNISQFPKRQGLGRSLFSFR
jgi:hypothetical protein